MATLLALIHASWETPHRILDAFSNETEVRTVEALEGDPLPDHDQVDGVVAMGGPMSANDDDGHPGLEAEREWLAGAVARDIPVLGVCLGAQLLARAMGASVRPAERPEIGFATIEVSDPHDPVLGALAPSATVLHWHGEVFDLPDGARPLAASAQTEYQAFRRGRAWGVLFHPEADVDLVERWMRVPSMVMEAGHAVGLGAAGLLPSQAEELEPDLIERTGRGLRAFAEIVESSAS